MFSEYQESTLDLEADFERRMTLLSVENPEYAQGLQEELDKWLEKSSEDNRNVFNYIRTGALIRGIYTPTYLNMLFDQKSPKKWMNLFLRKDFLG